MGRTCVLELTRRQRQTLTRVRDHHPKPHLRAKAAALLKVADGWQVRDVARLGLLRPHARNTVSAWVARYRARGLAGLKVRAGRGRKPAFSPR
jgi:transposase